MEQEGQAGDAVTVWLDELTRRSQEITRLSAGAQHALREYQDCVGRLGPERCTELGLQAEAAMAASDQAGQVFSEWRARHGPPSFP